MTTEVEVVEAAAVGDRITHDDDLPEPQLLELLRRALGQLSGVLRNVGELVASGRGAARSARIGVRLTKPRRREPTLRSGGLSEAPTDRLLESERCPSPHGSVVCGSEDTFVGKEIRAAALVDHEPIECERHSDKPLVTGAATVFVNDRPWARRLDETECGGWIGEGEPTVWLPAQPTTDERLAKQRTVSQRGCSGVLGALVGTTMADGLAGLAPNGVLPQRKADAV